MALILAGGEGAPDNDAVPLFFADDDLLAACRPRGLPIGNLTSQFWSNCYLHGLDRAYPVVSQDHYR